MKQERITTLKREFIKIIVTTPVATKLSDFCDKKDCYMNRITGKIVHLGFDDIANHVSECDVCTTEYQPMNRKISSSFDVSFFDFLPEKFSCGLTYDQLV